MRLISVYESREACQVLYDLLAERDPIANISHKEMPSIEDHCGFVALHPYAAWYLIDVTIPPHEPGPIFGGSIYLTEDDEIGIALFKIWQGRGIGAEAVKFLMEMHPRERYLANVAPANLASQQFFLKLGFKPLQVTYELTP